MYDENGIGSSTHHQGGQAVNQGQQSDSNSPADVSSSAASDCCSLDSSNLVINNDRLLNQQLLFYQSLAAASAAASANHPSASPSTSLLPFLAQQQQQYQQQQLQQHQHQQQQQAVALAAAYHRKASTNHPSNVGGIGGSNHSYHSTTQHDPNNMALMNTSLMNVKDSRWLQVEVCREFQRGQCSRNEQECKFAHPPPHVDVQNGKVTACYDHLKGRCTRDNPKCKFLHAPQHLKDQLLLNGRNNLALKNYMTQLTAQASIMPSTAAANTAAAIAASNQFTSYSPFGAAMPGAGAALVQGGLSAYPYAYLNTAVYPGLMGATSQDALGAFAGMLPTGAATSPVSMMAAAQQAQKAAIVRVDRVEALQNTPVNKRAALEKGGVPVFQPMNPMHAAGINAMAYPQFAAAAAAFPGFQASYVPVTFAGHPPGVPRF